MNDKSKMASVSVQEWRGHRSRSADQSECKYQHNMSGANLFSIFYVLCYMVKNKESKYIKKNRETQPSFGNLAEFWSSYRM